MLPKELRNELESILTKAFEENDEMTVAIVGISFISSDKQKKDAALETGVIDILKDFSKEQIEHLRYILSTCPDTPEEHNKRAVSCLENLLKKINK